MWLQVTGKLDLANKKRGGSRKWSPGWLPAAATQRHCPRPTLSQSNNTGILVVHAFWLATMVQWPDTTARESIFSKAAAGYRQPRHPLTRDYGRLQLGAAANHNKLNRVQAMQQAHLRSFSFLLGASAARALALPSLALPAALRFFFFCSTSEKCWIRRAWMNQTAANNMFS